MAAIESYGFGRVTIDGREETRDVIVLPDHVVRRWWRQDGHRLVLEDLVEVLDELPERLLIGTGAYRQMRPDPGTLEALSADLMIDGEMTADVALSSPEAGTCAQPRRGAERTEHVRDRRRPCQDAAHAIARADHGVVRNEGGPGRSRR
jgi:hypothetical protein